MESEQIKVNVQDNGVALVASLWVDGQYIITVPCSTTVKRFKWLPSWFPGNRDKITTIRSIERTICLLRKMGETIVQTKAGGGE